MRLVRRDDIFDLLPFLPFLPLCFCFRSCFLGFLRFRSRSLVLLIRRTRTRRRKLWCRQDASREDIEAVLISADAPWLQCPDRNQVEAVVALRLGCGDMARIPWGPRPRAACRPSATLLPSTSCENTPPRGRGRSSAIKSRTHRASILTSRRTSMTIAILSICAALSQRTPRSRST